MKSPSSYPFWKKYLRFKESQTIAGFNIKKGWKQSKLTIKVFGIISFWGVGPLVRITGTTDWVKYLELLETRVEPIQRGLKRAARAELGSGA